MMHDTSGLAGAILVIRVGGVSDADGSADVMFVIRVGGVSDAAGSASETPPTN